MRDTTPEAEQVLLQTIRRMPPIDRLQAALELSESVRALALARMRVLHPGLSQLELVELLIGESLLPPGAARSGA